MPARRSISAPWYSPDLWDLRQVLRRKERRGLRSHQAAALKVCQLGYKCAVFRAKEAYVTLRINSARNRPADLFSVVSSLVYPDYSSIVVCPTEEPCGEFRRYFDDRITCIRVAIRHPMDPVICLVSAGKAYFGRVQHHLNPGFPLNPGLDELDHI
ncbi:hypothetical protein FKM82_019392 [Ascaphus truei]